jgi:hypothetical protein
MLQFCYYSTRQKIIMLQTTANNIKISPDSLFTGGIHSTTSTTSPYSLNHEKASLTTQHE